MRSSSLLVVVWLGPGLFACTRDRNAGVSADAGPAASLGAGTVTTPRAIAEVGPRATPAAAAPSSATSPAPTPAASGGSSTTKSGTCFCRPLNGQAGLTNTIPLCKAVTAPKCRCETTSNYRLCLAPWTKGKDELACSKPNTYAAGRTPGAACEGYTTGEDKDGNPKNEKESGTYGCTYCDNMRTYGGLNGDACTGFGSADGKPFKGKIDCSN